MLLDLSLVSEALLKLIHDYINASPEAAAVGTFEVSPEPRDKLKGAGTIGFYLYHITEDAHFKNLSALSADTPPLRFTPMGLSLYYQLSAHSDTTDEFGIKKEQLLIGLAMKALRDYPVVDDSTEIPIVKDPPHDYVFPLGLRGADNRFRISLLPITHNEALNFSTSGEHRLRLAVYYQVSVALLEPEKPTLRAGRVLKYGVFTFTRGAPRLDGSRATVTFTMPDGTAASAETQPAEVFIRNTGANTGGELILFGSDLSGDQTTLLIKNKRFESIEVPPEWGVTSTDSQVFAVVQATAGPAKILPGIYSAAAKVTTHQLGPGNMMRTFIKTSNEMPFIVTPRIDSISAPNITGPSNVGFVTVIGAVFKDAPGLIESIEVFVGPHRLPLREPTDPFVAGNFEVMSATELIFHYPIAGINSGETVPFRLIINGAESAPNWVTAP